MDGEGNFNWRFVFPFDYLLTEQTMIIRKKVRRRVRERERKRERERERENDIGIHFWIVLVFRNTFIVLVIQNWSVILY